MGFKDTSDFHRWLSSTVFDGDCCTIDHETWGKVNIHVNETGQWTSWATLERE